MFDKQGRAYATVADTKAGDTLETDAGFTCMPAGAKKLVQEHKGELFISCSGMGNPEDEQNEKHNLDGQIDDTGTFYVGLYPV